LGHSVSEQIKCINNGNRLSGRHRGLISDNDWHVVWSLTNDINIRDSVASLQFSDDSTLVSSHDLNDIVLHLATDDIERC